ncbi:MULTISPECIES: glutaminyl-peptide cyclotransferase [Reichenbachiella]|uniref:Glutamine cyclotransferase n=1 Tax=Reichenbachiella agariperforans TaxID=156994 RepID=A0A1M6LAU7_REIAG|nr:MULTISPECIES: glutaminyl-peptide cyclotransferase [Reichenbachiella]MBU2913855.1 glutaminyl-peptide cyclotransferase [Reichenbachiella agariperforans]RJE74226.1 hypothetical protein BGP76_13660 [Reichenbachiella sp. MSK19-1]SHJ68293.1 Glutamine cyclotransferase [Reichenbachiella agariperforans]
MKIHQSLTLIAFLVVIFSCESPEKKQTATSPRKKQISKITSPKNNSRFHLKDTVTFDFSMEDTSISIDSIIATSDRKTLFTSKNKSRATWGSDNFKTGTHSIILTLHLSNQTIERQIVNLTFLADSAPEQLSYHVINSYPHDPKAYTQGLTQEEGALYESTGQKGASSLRKVDLKTGKTLQNKELEYQYFGEGITIKGDSMYMLTWQAKQGFIFNKKDFEMLGTFHYNTEGWGLATLNSDTLLMSDGSHRIYFKDPNGFSDLKILEVYDHKGKIDYLNELEYINGKIYANRYQTDNIYIIDPHSGKAEAVLNLSGILQNQDINQEIDVLNGIAFNPLNKTYYITGKWWPKLFEIKIINQQQEPI